ncbi:MAG TPA: AAA family ATPase [Blastocatellia bacterium]|nr:AAA family ATPase [Blastocatellia bacterium]
MPEAATEPRRTDEDTPYPSSWAHISDELRRLDLLIHLEVLKQSKRQPANPLDQFKGLVISEEEVAGLLEESDDASTGGSVTPPDDSKALTLAESLNQLESRIERRRSISLNEGIDLSLPRLSQLFNLTRFEEQSLLICLAIELDRKYEKLYGYLQDDVTRKSPSVDLVLSLVCHTTEEAVEARLAFDQHAPLLKHRLLQMTESLPDRPLPLLSRPLKLDDRIVNFLLDFGQMDAQLGRVARLFPPHAEPSRLTERDEEIRGRLAGLARSHFKETRAGKGNLVLFFSGPYGSGKSSLAKAICFDLGFPLVVGDVSGMLAAQIPFEEIIWLLGREALLQQAALCLENFDGLLADDDRHRPQLKRLLEAVRTFSGLTFLCGSRPWKPLGLLEGEVFISEDFPIPDEKARKQLWADGLEGGSAIALDVDPGALASKFRLTPGQIRDALVEAQNLARWRSPDAAQVTVDDLHAACRAQSSPKLGALARKVEAKYVWDDIVLPPDQLSQIREICNQAKYRHIVYGEWGFDRKLSLGKGLNALFSGPPGTGKTMAAEVIANELQLDLYKIDLSQVVSKYIGETEKNLHNIFREAQSSAAILFFDEADALFGKRSEVKDAHDRYANIEIGYLLQKMEEYDGIAILATNLRQNMDEAFVRRMQFIVEFPFPDEDYRRRIWEVIFPSEAPIAEDVDFAVLARDVRLAGGNIKSIALAAAFFAASDGQVIRMPHLIGAARREYQKLGRAWNDAGRSTPREPVP